MIDSFYRNNSTVKLKYDFTKDKKIVEKRLAEIEELSKYEYLYYDNMTEYDKLAKFINDDLGYIFISADDIKKIVEEEF